MDTDVAEIDDPLAAGWQALAVGDWAAARVVFAAAVEREQSAEALEGLGMAAWWLNDAAATFQAREAAYRRYHERGDRRGDARLAVFISGDHFSRRGERAVANGWVRRAYRLLDGLEPGPEHAMVPIWESHMAVMVDHDTARARRLCADAAELSRALGSIDLEMLAQAIEGYARVCEGDLTEGMRLLDEATTAAVAGDMTDPDSIVVTCCFLIYACERVRDFDRAAQWCAKVSQLAARWSYRLLFSVCRTHYAGILISRGAWPEAESVLAAATDELAATHPAMAVEGIVRLAELRRCQGRFDEADALFARLDAHPLRMLGSTPALLGRAALALDRGDPTAAADLAERYLRAVLPGDRMEQVAGLELLVRAQVALGDHDRAARTLRGLVAIATEIPTPALRGSTSFSEGVVAVATGDYEAARRRFEDATDLFEQGGASYEVARARLELASVLAALGRAAAASREAQAAAEALERIGAARERDRALAVLRSVESSDPDAAEAGMPQVGLTPREIEVLRLVAQGQGDKEIAATLGLSEHTVHRHISNVLTKLALPSRAAAVAQAAQLGLLGVPSPD